MACVWYYKPCIKFSRFLGFDLVFLESQDIKFDLSNHATLKMSKCEDNHIATCMLDNKANPMKVLGPEDVWRYWQELNFATLNKTWKCALIWYKLNISRMVFCLKREKISCVLIVVFMTCHVTHSSVATWRL